MYCVMNPPPSLRGGFHDNMTLSWYTLSTVSILGASGASVEGVGGGVGMRMIKRGKDEYDETIKEAYKWERNENDYNENNKKTI